MPFAFAILTIIIALVSLIGFVRTLRARNVFGAGFAFTSFAVFAFFGVATLIDDIKNVLGTSA